MKTLLSISLVAATAVVLTGCSQTGPSQADVNQIQSEMKAQTPADAKPMAPEDAMKGVQMMGKKGGGSQGGPPAAGAAPNAAPANAN